MSKEATPPPCPEWLEQLLRQHRDAFEPEYDGFLSDHLPMMLLAMYGLGIDRKSIESRHTRYVRRLTAASKNDVAPIKRVEDGFGDRHLYRALVQYFDNEINSNGVDETLGEYLLPMLSGWVRHAFHGTIRLAYGIRFAVRSEIAAGLAYLASAGPDARLAKIGAIASAAERFVWPSQIDIAANRFDDRYAEVMQANTLHVHTHVVADNVRRVADEVLAIFNHTQDFFALHMVTGIHAMDICAKAIDVNVDGLLNAGVSAAYLTIGAPMFVLDAKPRPINRDFAHAVKVAFSCFDQASRLHSNRYTEAFGVYGEPFG